MKNNTSNDFHTLIRLASAGARGKDTACNIEDWKKIYGLAMEQSVLPLLGSVLLENPELAYPEELKVYLMDFMRSLASKNMIRRLRIQSLIEELGKAGFQVQLLKGYVMADCYAYPECRSSVDTDILIPKDQEQAVCSFLRSKGFVVDDRSSVSHHAVGRHQKYGMVEVHVNLYDEIVEEVWFRNRTCELLIEPPLIVETPEGSFATIGYTDHLIFLMLHMIKHFISHDLGLGMMLDIALYWKKYRDMIDVERIWTLMDELKFSTIISCVLHSLIRYGDFEEADFAGLRNVTDEQIDMLLWDLERGGRMGINDAEERQDSAFVYGRMIMLRDAGKWHYWCYMLRWKVKGLISALFPSKAHIAKKYPYVEEKPWLLPVAWLHRLVFRSTKALKNDRTGQQIRTEDTFVTQEVREREDLFNKLDMI